MHLRFLPVTLIIWNLRIHNKMIRWQSINFSPYINQTTTQTQYFLVSFKHRNWPNRATVTPQRRQLPYKSVTGWFNFDKELRPMCTVAWRIVCNLQALRLPELTMQNLQFTAVCKIKYDAGGRYSSCDLLAFEYNVRYSMVSLSTQVFYYQV